jgi:hypothetical protein
LDQNTSMCLNLKGKLFNLIEVTFLNKYKKKWRHGEGNKNEKEFDAKKFVYMTY